MTNKKNDPEILEEKKEAAHRRMPNFMAFLSIAAMGVLIARLYQMCIVDHDFYFDKANSAHFKEETIASERGSIYDANGIVLAQSTTNYTIYVDPVVYRAELEELKEKIEKETQNTEDKDRVSQKWKTIEEVEDDFFLFLSQKLGVDIYEIETDFYPSSETLRYKIIVKNVDSTTKSEIEEYLHAIPLGKKNEISDEGQSQKRDLTWSFSCIGFESNEIRSYPQGTLAASVLGFLNSEKKGIYGLEAYYNEELTGTDGKSVTALNGGRVINSYEAETIDAINGNSVYLTLDATVQGYVETAIQDMNDSCQVAERSCSIVMNAKTGAILAMATTGGFDPNNPYEITDKNVLALENVLSDEEYSELKREAQEKQWKNKAISEIYVPGSVFKVITSSSALEENKISVGSYFDCTGSVVVNGITIHCHEKLHGHGYCDFTTQLTNSCNPTFIEIGKRLGGTLFFQYFEAFGLTTKTGIDLPGESNAVYASQTKLENNDLTLAACSYGQNNAVTPIQMITAYAAVVNGGYLLQPHVVDQIVDQDGNVVKEAETTVVRQVISSETSEEMRTALKAVVNNNGGGNAYIKGYSIGGKSGTSQKLKQGVSEENCEYVASYVCFAPAEDPEIIVLVMADEPNKTNTYYGSTVAVPCARKIMEKVLPYEGIYPEYTEEEQEKLDITVPNMVEQSKEQAIQIADNSGLKYEIIGNGNMVYAQSPVAETSVAKDGTVYLYTERIYTVEKTLVPSVEGQTLEVAKQELTRAGLNYVCTGSDTDRQDSIICSQSVSSGKQVEKGTVIELEFMVNNQGD